jgi:hypothetical protein
MCLGPRWPVKLCGVAGSGALAGGRSALLGCGLIRASFLVRCSGRGWFCTYSCLGVVVMIWPEEKYLEDLWPRFSPSCWPGERSAAVSPAKRWRGHCPHACACDGAAYRWPPRSFFMLTPAHSATCSLRHDFRVVLAFLLASMAAAYPNALAGRPLCTAQTVPEGPTLLPDSRCGSSVPRGLVLIRRRPGALRPDRSWWRMRS